MPMSRKETRGSRGFVVPIFGIVLLLVCYWLLSDWQHVPEIFGSALPRCTGRVEACPSAVIAPGRIDSPVLNTSFLGQPFPARVRWSPNHRGPVSKIYPGGVILRCSCRAGSHPG
jgi:hypothetical protein